MTRRNFMVSAPALASIVGGGVSVVSGSAASAEWARLADVLPEKGHSSARSAARSARVSDGRPNVLLLMTDQQTYDALGCAGNAFVRTPNMDYLARRGVRFARCYCPSSACSPSRASMLSGRLPHETKVRHNNLSPDPALPLVGHVLRSSGYDSTWVGKWHLPRSFPRESELQGLHHLPLPEGLAGKFLGASTDMHVSQAAADYLRWHAGLSSKPWFLGVSLHNPHDICHYFFPAGDRMTLPEPEPELQDASSLPPLPSNFRRDPEEPEFLKIRRGFGEMGKKPSMSRMDWRCYLQTYHHLTQSVDRCLAPILDALSSGGWLDNTLVVFTSDHGEGVACHEWFTKVGFYEHVARVPFIVVPPGGFRDPSPRVDDASLVSLFDFMPTVLDYAGVPRSDWPVQRGRSLRPLIEGRGDPEDRGFVVAHLDPSFREPEMTARMLVSSDRWKYCRYDRGARREQLFNLGEDPGETRDLARDRAFKARKERLAALLKGWCESTDDPFAEIMS